jgi:two-component system, OmpR family, sensor kinase
MALVLAATGLFLYLRLGAELDRSIDSGLRSRADEVSALIEQSDSGLRESGGSRLAKEEQSFAQILDVRGRVVDSTSKTRGRPVLAPTERARAERHTLFLDRRSLHGLDDGPARLLATPIQAQDQRLIVIVGTSSEDRNGALANLGTLLLIGGPVALLLASLTGYGAVSGSLRPVERMRRRAEAISAGKHGQRLPLPPARDEIGRLGRTLNDMLARLEEAFNRERTFVSDASHELRTPLTILKGEIEMALRRGRSADELATALRAAGEETDRVVQLAEDLLVIARSDQGKLPVRLSPVEVGEILAELRKRFSIRSRDANKALVVDTTEKLRITADPLRLRQALGNMVDNALRYGEGTVSLSARKSNGYVELHVTDEGPGFPPDFVDSTFERFSRAREGGTPGGTGLGLAISEAIARAHRGTVGAANRPGGGADVWLALPSNPS